MMSTESPEPKDSASSSLDDQCVTCAHPRNQHFDYPSPECVECAAIAGPEGDGWHHAFVLADAETAEPECDGCAHAAHGNEPCSGCPCGHPVPMPRRPPYAVAYEIGDGRMYEVALAGDAVATVEDGVLKVSHPEGVVHMIQVKPMEGA